MGFMIHSVDDNRVLGLEYLPVSAITQIGRAHV